MKLVIAEKPSVAKAIAPVIGATTQKGGYIEGNGYYVSWCYGHLVRLFMPDDYCETWAAKQWTFQMLPMLPDVWRFKVASNCKEQFDTLKRLMHDNSVSEIICATDADREGECIFRYVYYLAGCKKPSSGCGYHPWRNPQSGMDLQRCRPAAHTILCIKPVSAEAKLTGW